MVRKGSRKAKTGCLTCKIRKVKCDEAKPVCRRCTTTGRKCDGYPPRVWDELLHEKVCGAIVQAPASTVHVSDREARALDFFRCVVAPVLSGHSSSYFWTQLVAQVGDRESAVRHAVVAISSIYEQMPDTVIRLRPGVTTDDFAIGQYNKALTSLASSTPDANIVVFTCVLFICIEILRSNTDAAINHCRHGIMILNASTRDSAWARDCLLPLFQRLSIFPFFFGGTVSNFPCLAASVSEMSLQFATLGDALFALDRLMSRAIRFIRSVDAYRLGISQFASIPSSLYRDKADILLSLAEWQREFGIFKSKTPASPERLGDYLILTMKYLVATTWLHACLDRSEMAYDSHLANFKEVVDCALQIHMSESRKALNSPSKPKFLFEMGYMPLLYFVVIKCRLLSLRLDALQAMVVLAAPRENLWDASLMHAVGQRVIELEHGVDLSTRPADSSVAESRMPSDEMRIRDSMVIPDLEHRIDTDGDVMLYRKVCFLTWRTGGQVGALNEWIAVHPQARERQLRFEIGASDLLA